MTKKPAGLGLIMLAVALVALGCSSGSKSDEAPEASNDAGPASQLAEGASPGADATAAATDTAPGTVTPQRSIRRLLTPVAPQKELPPLVEPDLDYLFGLEDAQISTGGWKTDFSRHSVPYLDIITGNRRRDGIPPIYEPTFVSAAEADQWIADQEPVVAFELNGEARAYPIQIMIWHEIVNDIVGDVPVVVTFCPLCNSAIVFKRELDGLVFQFGTSGKLRNSDLVMWDWQTESWWQQLTGEAIVGKLTGYKLEFLPTAMVSYADFKASHPKGEILSRETGHGRTYGKNPYFGYDRIGTDPFSFDGVPDDRLAAVERVVAVTIDGVDAAFPFSVLANEQVVNYSIGGQDIAVFFKSGTVSPLDKSSIRDSRDVGSSGVFKATLGERKLTFRANGDKIVDAETGSEWNIFGKAVAGQLAGSQLDRVVHGDHFWFAWAVFKPETIIYKGSEG